MHKKPDEIVLALVKRNARDPLLQEAGACIGRLQAALTIYKLISMGWIDSGDGAAIADYLEKGEPIEWDKFSPATAQTAKDALTRAH